MWGSGFEVVGEGASVEDAVEILKELPVDIVLQTLNFGLQRGLDFMRAARSLNVWVKAVIVSAPVSDADAASLTKRDSRGR